MTPISSFLFNLDNTYPKGFPNSLDLAEDDPLSIQTYHECYVKAQQGGIPYYAVLVVESSQKADAEKKQSERTFFHAYDMSGFLANSTKKGEALDPVSCQAITKIHLFVVRCFESDPEKLFKPIDPYKDQLTFQPFPLRDNEVTNKQFKDALNNVEHPSAENRLQLRSAQSLIADLICSGNFFPQLTAEKRYEEARLWLWCLAQGSGEGAVKLFKACVNDPALMHAAPVYNTLLLKISQISKPEALTTRVEREACLHAKVLVKQYDLH